MSWLGVGGGGYTKATIRTLRSKPKSLEILFLGKTVWVGAACTLVCCIIWEVERELQIVVVVSIKVFHIDSYI